MATTIIIKGESGSRVQVSVQGYERAASSDPYDSNWLACTVAVHVGGFEGGVEAAMQTYDFARFSAALDGLLEGTEKAAGFTTMEEALGLRLEADNLGHIAVSGTIASADRTTTLSFAIETDQTYLKSTQDQLHAALAEFPVRQSG